MVSSAARVGLQTSTKMLLPREAAALQLDPQKNYQAQFYSGRLAIHSVQPIGSAPNRFSPRFSMTIRRMQARLTGARLRGSTCKRMRVR